MEVKGGVAYSSKSGALYMRGGVATYGSFDGQLFSAPPDICTDYSSAIYSRWGADNCLPLEMADHIENCGVLNAALDAKARIAVGKGFQPFLRTNITQDGKEELEHVSDPEIQDWLEDNNFFDVAMDLSFDRNGYGWSPGSLILNKERTRINRVRRIDVVKARLQKMERIAKGNTINSLILCNDWKKVTTPLFDKDKMTQIPALREGYELQDLIERAAGSNTTEYAFFNRSLRNGRDYYPMPLWYAARNWVKVARSVPAFKNAMFTNQITIKYVITISDKYWETVYEDWDDDDTYDDAKRQKIREEKYDEIDKWLTGEDKAYKSLSCGSYWDEVAQKEVPFIHIETIDDKVKDGKLLPESSAANSEILFAIAMNPALIGAGQPGGPYSNNAGGSNIRESYLIQLMLLEAERKENSNILNLVKRFNGWDKRLQVERTVSSTYTTGNTAVITQKKITPRLVFRCVSGLLTTLDTGNSTKSEPL
ncbi:MAG: hypothetical protein JO301_16990 [Chitinophagaceae bacterium]|nr:hypothetical protein [Chitinophagaceae bacterium]